MLKIKEKFHRLLELSKELLHQFPATLIVVLIATLFVTFFCIDSDLDNDFIGTMMLFLVSYFAGTFFAECIFKEIKWKITSYIVAGCISIFFGVYLIDIVDSDFWSLFYIGYIIVLMLMGIYFILKKSKLTFQEYLTTVFSNMFFVSIVYGILAVSVTFLSWIFVELIFGDFEYAFFRTNALVFGLYYVTGCIYAVSSVQKKELNTFIKNLIQYVLMPLVGVAMGIIYLYILKIFITGEIPSNVIFRICAVLFVFAFPIWNMFEVAREKGFKISKIFSYAYIPLLVLEIYALSVRVISLGLTPIRYFGIFFVAFQTLSLILNFFWNKEKLPKLVVCAAIFVALFTMTPMTPSKVSSINQLYRLEKNIPEGSKFNELSEEAQEKVQSAYKYLRYEKEYDNVPNYIKEQEKEILGYSKDSSSYTNRNNYYSFYADERINVAGYSYATKFYSNNSFKGIYQFDTDGKSYEADEEKINSYVLQLVQQSSESGEWRKNIANPYLELEDFTLYFTGIHAYYDKVANELSVESIEGFILE